MNGEGSPRIRKLSDALANQIAAGEVVERPASVVKELVENAVDASATRVTVEVEQGGLARLAVTDDGIGMIREDAETSLERHATSKIARIEDLERLASFGFRGEALPSIASVSKLTLTTRVHGASEAYRVEVVGGKVASRGPAGAPPGTRIDVVDLFFNVPARRKFLKAPATESAHVGEVVSNAALARPEIAFRLVRDGKVARDYLRARSRGERVAQVVSGEELREVRGERGPYRIEAYLTSPERARSGAVGLDVFVNDRPVRDRAIARAVAQSYGSVLPPGRYPVGVLYIDMPPEGVDVNVHPQKAEVRFHDAREVQGAVIRVLNEGLGRVFAIPALGLGPSRVPVIATAGDTPSPSHSAPPITLPSPILAATPASHAELREPAVPPYVPSRAASALFPEAPTEDLHGALFAPAVEGFYSKLRYLAQSRETFLLCEGSDGLYVLDQHAAAERVAYHALRRAYAERKVASQTLLLPELVEVGERAVGLIDEAAEEVSRMGLDVRAAGERTLAVHAVPLLLARGKARPGDLLRDVLSELSRVGGRAFGARVDLVFATMACHASVRAGDTLDPMEVRALLSALDEVDFSGHCPHGRPIVMRLSFEELARRVGR